MKIPYLVPIGSLGRKSHIREMSYVMTKKRKFFLVTPDQIRDCFWSSRKTFLLYEIFDHMTSDMS